MKNVDRNMRLVEFLLESPDFSLAVLCKCLENYPSLVEELQADLRAEIGALEIEEHVRREAASMVHKQFGTSRRFSESDKRQITSMIAYKYQIARETCRRHVISLTADLEKAQEEHKNFLVRVNQLKSKVELFIRQNELDSIDKYYDMRTTSDALREAQGSEEEDPLTQLGNHMYLLMNKYIRLVTEKEGLLKRGKQAFGFVNREQTKDVSRNWLSICDRTRRSAMVNNLAKSHEETLKGKSPNTGKVEVRPLMWYGDSHGTRNPSDSEKQMMTALKTLKNRMNLLEEEVNLRDMEIESLKVEMQQRDQEVSNLRKALYQTTLEPLVKGQTDVGQSSMSRSLSLSAKAENGDRHLFPNVSK